MDTLKTFHEGYLFGLNPLRSANFNYIRCLFRILGKHDNSPWELTSYSHKPRIDVLQKIKLLFSLFDFF